MHGDFTRWTYRPEHAYRSVLLQQGRVLLDAEWNEQTEITAHHDEARMGDLVGGSGGPAPQPGTGPGGFAILAADGSVPASAAWADLVVSGPGTYYVDGILAESPEPPPVGGAPAPGWPLTDQPYLPAIGTGADAVPGLPEPTGGAGRYALYLDVWTHHVTADEEPALLEPALGGPDTTTRARTVWQVRWVRLAAGELCSDLHAAGWLRRGPRQMVAGLRPPAADTDPCQISTTGGYRRLENQLYRVQIHSPGDGSAAPTFTWSRDNGSVVARVTAIKPTTAVPPDAVLVLDRLGRDEELSFRQDDLVEVTSTDLELRGQPGFLATAGAPDGLELPVTWQDGAPDSFASLGRAPIVRRWDGGPLPASAAAGGTELEDGIVVRFPTGGTAATGDYWLVPARTVRLAYGIDALAGTIDWPAGPSGAGLALDPFGVVHHVTPLAVLARSGGTWTLESDCRLLFPPLTGLVALDEVGGDGQEAMPGDPLPAPVRVAVRSGGLPVQGATVRFGCATGELAVGSPPAGVPAPTAPASLDVVTGPDGVAEAFWRLDPDGPTTQTLTAQRLDDHLAGTDVQVVLTGRLSVAAQVAWEPACTGFAGTRTVQDALARLATTVELRALGGDGQHVAADGDVVPQQVRVGVYSPCGPVAGATVVATGSGKTALVAVAKEGAATPATLTGSGATSEAAAVTGQDGVAAFFWQPALAEAASDVLDVAVKGGDDAPVRVSAQLLPAVPQTGRTPGVHITRLRFAGGRDGVTEFGNDTAVPPALLASGISIDLDGPVVLPSVARKPVVRVVLELPWPLGGEAPMWSTVPVGYRAVELAADTNAEGPLIVWTPRPQTAQWLVGLPDLLRQHGSEEPVVGRFTIDGWAIISEKDPSQHLNGHARAVIEPGTARTILRLPTDDEVTGGAFVQWFRLGIPSIIQPPLPVVPNLAGMTRARAERTLADSGLTLGETRQEPSPDVRRNSVVRTEPAAGEQVPPGTAVTIVTSAGRP